MTTTKQLGIWMDHSSAHLMELAGDPTEMKTIESKFTPEEKENSLGKSENVMHNKEQHQQTEYYKKLAGEIKNYQEVVLFGPTTAKNELANLLKWDNHFKDIKVTVKHADKMTGNQQHAFVREHFLKTLN